jgi:hypothetical protein
MHRKQSSSIYHNLEMHHRKQQSLRNRRQPYRTAMSDELDDSSFSPINKVRNYASDSETSVDFTSVSEMEEKYRKHGRMRRRANSYTALSTTCGEDTEISVRVDIITVELNLNSGRPLGLNVETRQNQSYYGIYVGSIDPSKTWLSKS